MDLTQFARWFKLVNHEAMQLLRITPTDARHYKKQMITSGLKPSTINRRLLSLKYFIGWGLKTKQIQQSFSLPKPVKITKSAPKWLDKKQKYQLLRHIQHHGSSRDKAMVVLLLNTGLRVGELSSLKWKDICIGERKGRVSVIAGKGCKYRDVPLNKDAREILLSFDYVAHANEDTFIFMGQRGRLSSRGIQLALKRLVKGSDLENLSPHQLRHTFCKDLVNAGIGLEKVATLAGHDSLDTTKLYCQPSFDDLSDAVEQIGELE